VSFNNHHRDVGIILLFSLALRIASRGSTQPTVPNPML
jgi:hypothetical protein